MGYKDWFDRNHSFASFVKNIVLKEYKKDKCYKSYNEPCFNIDQHWLPFNARCMYCDISYKVIGRLETFIDDVNYILLKQNLTHLIPLLSDHSSPSEKQAHKITSENVTRQHFSQLNPIQIQELYDMFKIDFELFDYDFHSYLI